MVFGKILEINEDRGIRVRKEYCGNGLCEGYIYKNYEAFEKGEEICYIPEYSLANDENVHTEDFADHTTYTKEDFLNLCDGNEELARELFDWCWWQCPETLLNEWEDNKDV